MHASARKALGQAAVRPECAMGLNKHREGSMETRRRKTPPVSVCGTVFHSHTHLVFPLLPPSKHTTPLWRQRRAHPDHFQIQVSEISVDSEQTVFK